MRNRLFNLILESLACNQIWNIILILIILTFAALLLLHGLVALGKLSEGCEGVGAELVENTGYEFGEFLVLAVTVDSKGVGWDCGMNCGFE